jgi:hypothetical protein
LISTRAMPSDKSGAASVRAEKPAGRFMISRTRVVKRHPEGYARCGEHRSTTRAL